MLRVGGLAADLPMPVTAGGWRLAGAATNWPSIPPGFAETGCCSGRGCCTGVVEVSGSMRAAAAAGFTSARADPDRVRGVFRVFPVFRFGHQIFAPHVLQFTLKPPASLRTWLLCPQDATHSIGGNVETGIAHHFTFRLGAWLDGTR